MKKFAALLAFAAVLFTACNNKKGDDVVPLPKAPNQENHVYLKINPDDNIQIPLPDPDDQHRIHLRPRELPHADARHEVEDHRKKREKEKPA